MRNMGGGRDNQREQRPMAPRDIDELLSSNNTSFMKLNEKRTLFRNLLQTEGMHFKEALKCVTNSDAFRLLERAGVHRVKRSLQANVQAPKDPKADGKALWAKLTKGVKNRLKDAFETKKFKEALESVGMSAENVGVLNTLGREWCRLKVKEQFGVEIVMMPPGSKRTREELEESSELLKGLPEEELAAMRNKLKTMPFAKAMEGLSDEVKTALRKLGREGVREHWKEHLQIDMTLYEPPREERHAVAAKTPEKPGSKPTTPAKSGKVALTSGATAFATLTDEQKTELKGKLETLGFKNALEAMEFSKDTFEALLREGRVVMGKMMKEHFGEEIKLWTKEDDAKVKVIAFTKELKEQLWDAMVELTYTEAVLSLGESVTQGDRNVLRALTRDAVVTLLKEELGKEEELPKEEELRESCLTVGLDSMDDPTRLVLMRLLGKHSFNTAVMQEDLEISSLTRYKLMAAVGAKVVAALEEYFKMKVMTVLDHVRLLVLRQPPAKRMHWKTQFQTLKFDVAITKIVFAADEDKVLVAEVAKSGMKKVFEEFFGEHMVMFEDRPAPRTEGRMPQSRGNNTGMRNNNSQMNKRPRY